MTIQTLPRRALSVPDLTERVRMLGEVVTTLLERVDVLEEQRHLLLSKIQLLEGAA